VKSIFLYCCHHYVFFSGYNHPVQDSISNGFYKASVIDVWILLTTGDIPDWHPLLQWEMNSRCLRATRWVRSPNFQQVQNRYSFSPNSDYSAAETISVQFSSCDSVRNSTRGDLESRAVVVSEGTLFSLLQLTQTSWLREFDHTRSTLELKDI